MVNKRKLQLKLLNLFCYITDEPGADEIYLISGGKKIWPEGRGYKPVKPGQYALMVQLNGFDSGNTINIEVWDYDLLSANDLLGTIHIELDEPGGPFMTDMIQNLKKTDHARYSIQWELDYL